MANSSSFFDGDWTLLNKLNALADYLKEYNLDYKTWKCKGEWVYEDAYEKFDVVTEKYDGKVGVFVAIDDIPESIIMPHNDITKSEWHKLIEWNSGIYQHRIRIKRSTTIDVQFIIFTNDQTPFTFNTFAAKYPMGNPCMVLNGYVMSSNTYKGPVTDVVSISLTQLMIDYAIPNGAIGYVSLTNTDTFEDTVTVF